MSINPLFTSSLEGVKTGCKIGSEVYDTGKVVDTTSTGKTIETDKGYTFKWRRSKNKFALKGNAMTEMVLLRKGPAH